MATYLGVIKRYNVGNNVLRSDDCKYLRHSATVREGRLLIGSDIKTDSDVCCVFKETLVITIENIDFGWNIKHYFWGL